MNKEFFQFRFKPGKRFNEVSDSDVVYFWYYNSEGNKELIYKTFKNDIEKIPWHWKIIFYFLYNDIDTHYMNIIPGSHLEYLLSKDPVIPLYWDYCHISKDPYTILNDPSCDFVIELD